MEQKSVKDTLLERRSIRRYERAAVTDEQLNLIYEAIRNTPTSYNGQQFSVIDVDDPMVKEQLYAEIGQKQIKTCSHFMLFCIDYNKIYRLAKARALDMPRFYDTVDGLMVGVVDAALAMENALVAANSLGLGTCCIGYARTAAPAAVSRILKLPEKVFVVCGLAIGVPREMPDLKPKQPASLVIHHNAYRQDDLVPELAEYDATITAYNHTRAGGTSDNDWVSHILGYYREAMNYEILVALERRGFRLER